MECLLVDHVEVNSIIGGDLDSDISSDEIDLSSHFLKLVVLLPKASLFINLEEEDGA
jgi:hypothetical protein